MMPAVASSTGAPPSTCPRRRLLMDPTSTPPKSHGRARAIRAASTGQDRPAAPPAALRFALRLVLAMVTLHWVAIAASAEVRISVTITGTGLGRVTSVPPGINCAAVYFLNPAPGVCAATFPDGTAVTLEATPIPLNFSTASFLSIFGEFTGACSGTDPTCSVQPPADAEVTARFDPAPAKLTLSVAGNAGGIVLSDVGGLACRAGTCVLSFADRVEQNVTLTAVPDAGASFGGWTGCSDPNGPTCAQSANQFNPGFTATFTKPVPEDTLRFALLPSSRSTQAGSGGTFFATVLNTASDPVKHVAISAPSFPGYVWFETTDPQTNARNAQSTMLVDIPAGGMQTFLVTLISRIVVAPMDVVFTVAGDTAAVSSRAPGVDTVLFSASRELTPDVIAVSATVSGDGIVNIPSSTGIEVFTLATVNVGDAARITLTIDTGSESLPLSAVVCETDPLTSLCLAPPAATVTLDIGIAERHTFGVFASATASIAFLPERNRIFARFRDAGSVIRGATSVAVRTR